jgi:hypothetical protein
VRDQVSLPYKTNGETGKASMKCTVLSICYFEEYEESKRRMFFSELLE